MAETEYLTSPVCIGCHQELHATFSDTITIILLTGFACHNNGRFWFASAQW